MFNNDLNVIVSEGLYDIRTTKNDLIRNAAFKEILFFVHILVNTVYIVYTKVYQIFKSLVYSLYI